MTDELPEDFDDADTTLWLEGERRASPRFVDDRTDRALDER